MKQDLSIQVFRIGLENGTIMMDTSPGNGCWVEVQLPFNGRDDAAS